MSQRCPQMSSWPFVNSTLPYFSDSDGSAILIVFSIVVLDQSFLQSPNPLSRAPTHGLNRGTYVQEPWVVSV